MNGACPATVIMAAMPAMRGPGTDARKLFVTTAAPVESASYVSRETSPVRPVTILENGTEAPLQV